MFWEKLLFPIIGLSPMDGVTDAPMRYVAKKMGHPAVLYTEFVSAEGLWRLKDKGDYDHKIWKDLVYDESERPIIAQIFGSDPDSFYKSATILCEMGFDGIDINMGCPSPGLEKRGGGAGLIRDKCNAKEVIEATRQGVRDWSGEREVPVSVKSRIGSQVVDVTWWEFLASMKLPAVALHGRTFKQLYSGDADWEALFEAGKVIRQSGAKFLGNGDIKRVATIKGDADGPDCSVVVELKSGVKVDITGKMDGVLIGREAIGNPWILSSQSSDPSVREKLQTAVMHAKKFEEVFPEIKFFPMRKHLVKYSQGFDGASDLRKKLVLSESSADVERALRLVD